MYVRTGDGNGIGTPVASTKQSLDRRGEAIADRPRTKENEDNVMLHSRAIRAEEALRKVGQALYMERTLTVMQLADIDGVSPREKKKHAKVSFKNNF